MLRPWAHADAHTHPHIHPHANQNGNAHAHAYSHGNGYITLENANAYLGYQYLLCGAPLTGM